MAPTVGRIVHYTLTEGDVERITAALAPFVRRGNPVAEGDVLPAIVVRTFDHGEDTLLNLHVFLDGPDTLWVTSRAFGDDPGHWSWPPRV